MGTIINECPSSHRSLSTGVDQANSRHGGEFCACSGKKNSVPKEDAASWAEGVAACVALGEGKSVSSIWWYSHYECGKRHNGHNGFDCRRESQWGIWTMSWTKDLIKSSRRFGWTANAVQSWHVVSHRFLGLNHWTEPRAVLLQTGP